LLRVSCFANFFVAGKDRGVDPTAQQSFARKTGRAPKDFGQVEETAPN